MIHNNRCDYEKALEYYSNALTICRKVLGEYHTETARSYNNIGLVYYGLCKYNLALKYYFTTLPIYEEIYGNNKLHTATLYNNIGLAYCGLSDYDHTLEYHFKALDIRKGHPDIINSLNNIGLAYCIFEDYDNAFKHLFEALDLLNKKEYINQHETALCHRTIAFAYIEQKKYQDAKHHCDLALPIAKELGDKKLLSEIEIINTLTLQSTIAPKIGRNDPCPCGSGKKCKKCCGQIIKLS